MNLCCPFCGFEESQMTGYKGFQQFARECSKCEAKGPREITPAKATRAWNKRHTETKK